MEYPNLYFSSGSTTFYVISGGAVCGAKIIYWHNFAKNFGY